MSNFDLDLRNAEEQLDDLETADDVVLGVLDGTTDPQEWVRTVEYGNVLVLSVDGDLNELAAGFAREVKDIGGALMHFRGFLLVAPSDMDINSERL